MNLGDTKITKTLDLLVMLSRSRQHFPNGLTEEAKATLTVTRQQIVDAGLTVPEFTNSVHAIAEKGYLWHLVIFDETLRSQMNEFINSDQYNTVFEKLKELDTKEVSDKLKEATATQLRTMLPNGLELNQSEIDSERINLSEMFKEGFQVFSKMRSDEIGIVILMPFREITTLLDKMNSGERFEDIKDDGFWYNQEKFEFHIDDVIVPTSYQGKPNLEHSVLREFYDNTKVLDVTYDDLHDFDAAKGSAAYRDAMRRFVDKHPKLSSLFTVRKYNTVFHPELY